MVHLLDIAVQAMSDVLNTDPTVEKNRVTGTYQDGDSPVFELLVEWRADKRALAFVVYTPSVAFADRDGLSAFMSEISRGINPLLDKFDEETVRGDYTVQFPSENTKQHRIAMPVYRGGYLVSLMADESVEYTRILGSLWRFVRAGRVATPLFLRLEHSTSLPGLVECHRLISLGVGAAVLLETSSHSTPYDIHLRSSLFNQQGDALRLN